MISNASALIYTREKHIGFPGGWFKVQPEDFSEKMAKLVMEYAMSAMEDVKPLRSTHRQVRVVIAEGGYVVLGIAAYLRDLFSDGWEGIDEKNRPIYGFFGFVWKQYDFPQACAFPKLSEFANLITEHIRPNWELSKNAHWATHQELLSYRYTPCSVCSEPADDFTPVRIESVVNGEHLVQWAIRKAANGENVSVCTNVTIYDVKDYQTPFQYVSQAVSDKKYGSIGSTGGSSGSVGSGGKGSTGGQGATSGSGSNGGTGGNDGAGGNGRTQDPARNTGIIVPVALIVLGVVLLILALISLPVAWMAGLLWKALLVVGIACLAVGIIRLLKLRQKPEQEPIQVPEVPNSQQPTTTKIDADLFKTATKIEKSPAKVTTPKAKKPEDETTEDLFKF